MAAMNEPDDWRARVACVSADPELFFPLSSSGAGQRQEAEAKGFCALCQVRPQCLAFALATSQSHGVWGGTTEDERRRLRQAAAAATRPETVGAGPGRAAPGSAGPPA
jgi:WhiB family redox-sensing transcriptional regulator